MDKEIALDYLCSLEEEFIARADREVESGLNEQDRDEEEEKQNNNPYVEVKKEEAQYDELNTAEFYDTLDQETLLETDMA